MQVLTAQRRRHENEQKGEIELREQDIVEKRFFFKFASTLSHAQLSQQRVTVKY
jgi:hypothetical protein